jgi:SAM-dependent methyltransferase
MRRRVSRAQRAAFSRLVRERGERPEALFLDIGSGILGGANADGLSAHVRSHTIPLEIAPTSGVGVVGDAHKLPWRDAVADGVLIQGVLEHVLDPERIVGEIHRVLRPGGVVIAEVPFIQHYHEDPVDFRRWTHYGFAHLFRAFETVDTGVCAGPASALTDMLTEFPALLFSSPKLYWAAKVVSGWLFAPLQLLDAVWARSPRAHVMGGAVFFLGRKRPAGE